MLRQDFSVDKYWKVIVFYNVDYNFFSTIAQVLREQQCPNKFIQEIYSNLKSRKAKAVTFSNAHTKSSVVIFNTHFSKVDYINSLVHEAEHIKQAILRAYRIKDTGEQPAYTIGHLISQMWPVFSTLIYKC